MIALRCHQNARRELTAGYTPDLPPAKDVYELAWNCETEYNLNKIREELQDSRNTAEYRNFGVNVGSLISMITNWFYNEYPNALPSMKYEGKNDSLHFANMAKWNATETACSFGSYDNGNSAMMICAYNVKGAVVGETIYEIAKAGEYPCKEGTECGTDGKCVNGLCKVPIGIHG
ncbi:hypothetical protein Q1695_004124 [Nippostrongylus brasiliensis]|nr:hypothetical protein Q1695_004124 [Nippostrongylus brasiliensis]